jgi:hypothetical protein
MQEILLTAAWLTLLITGGLAAGIAAGLVFGAAYLLLRNWIQRHG